MNTNFEKALKCNDLVIDIEQLENQGFSFEDPESFICYMQSIVDYLYHHNKNYTKEQYRRIETMYNLLNCISW